ncbi:putative helicase mov-10-B.1 [Nasonia vitripennis]|uniref:RNA helicase n=1 Tax=Nasonia vitripennis TaxID=7425 RepID=A0A7M7QCU0_NASVI|nr:putative helicase mov-10-B.1 [Nasonia vitripennis]XP_031783599.1 putative helicase mov-10-B.1 [Nasonia vitripennis]
MVPEFWIPEDLKAILLKDGESYADMTEKSERFLGVLKKLRNVDRLELSQSHYLQFLKLGLYLEEFQQNLDLRKFNLYGKKIERVAPDSKEFRIRIKYLDKDHPLHKSCNLIEIFNSKDVTRKKFVLRAKEVKNDQVIAVAYSEFCDGHNPENSYNIRFRTNNYSFRCSHYALSLINSHKMTSYLFPIRKESYVVVDPEADGQRWCNKAISENPEQKQAVFNIIRKSAFPAPYILYGPPGTGKTATLVEAICQIWHNTGDTILICAPSNAAADVIAKRLLKYIPATSVDRIYSRSRDSSLIDADLQTCSNCSNGRIVKVNNRVVSSKRIVVSTLCTCTRLLFLDLSHSYSYVFIDEAGQATEPESLIAFNVISRHGDSECQIVISGDPKQLGPSVRSKYAAPILGQSLLERLMKLEPYVKHNNNDYDSRYITKLLRNYRSHPAIIRVSNELYYENELVACSDQRPFVGQDFDTEFPVIFHGVHGFEQKENNSTSSYNIAEAKQVMIYVNQLIGEKIGEKTIGSEDIGIVTPFALQSKHLQKTLKNENLEDVSVGTVEVFQGQEKEVIIMSAVRTKIFTHDDREHIGFLSNPRRFNVALTRARAALVVVGNPTALQTDDNWRYFLKFCRDNGACRGEQFELREKVEEKRSFQDDEGLQERSEQSSDLFEETFSILKIDDGIIRRKKNKYLLNGMYYAERECSIL